MIRKAKIADVPPVQKMLGEFARDGRLLARSLSELYTNLRDMYVYVDGETQQIAGCCSLHIIWENLAEVRSLAVAPSHHKRGIGRLLVQACIDEARELGIKQVFALTYKDKFFQHLGFRVVDKNIFPQKIWADCLHCPKFPECDEIALVLDLSEG
jgi:amino-acid N-acetyltransferase